MCEDMGKTDFRFLCLPLSGHFFGHPGRYLKGHQDGKDKH